MLRPLENFLGSLFEGLAIKPPVGHPHGLMFTMGKTPATREEMLRMHAEAAEAPPAAEAPAVGTPPPPAEE